MKEKYLTLEQLAADETIPLTKMALYRMALEGQIRGYKVRGKWLFLLSEVYGRYQAGRRPKGLGTAKGYEASR